MSGASGVLPGSGAGSAAAGRADSVGRGAAGVTGSGVDGSGSRWLHRYAWSVCLPLVLITVALLAGEVWIHLPQSAPTLFSAAVTGVAVAWSFLPAVSLRVRGRHVVVTYAELWLIPLVVLAPEGVAALAVLLSLLAATAGPYLLHRWAGQPDGDRGGQVNRALVNAGAAGVAMGALYVGGAEFGPAGAVAGSLLGQCAAAGVLMVAFGLHTVDASGAVGVRASVTSMLTSKRDWSVVAVSAAAVTAVGALLMWVAAAAGWLLAATVTVVVVLAVNLVALNQSRRLRQEAVLGFTSSVRAVTDALVDGSPGPVPVAAYQDGLASTFVTLLRENLHATSALLSVDGGHAVDGATFYSSSDADVDAARVRRTAADPALLLEFERSAHDGGATRVTLRSGAATVGRLLFVRNADIGSWVGLWQAVSGWLPARWRWSTHTDRDLRTLADLLLIGLSALDAAARRARDEPLRAAGHRSAVAMLPDEDFFAGAAVPVARARVDGQPGAAAWLVHLQVDPMLLAADLPSRGVGGAESASLARSRWFRPGRADFDLPLPVTSAGSTTGVVRVLAGAVTEFFGDQPLAAVAGDGSVFVLAVAAQEWSVSSAAAAAAVAVGQRVDPAVMLGGEQPGTVAEHVLLPVRPAAGPSGPAVRFSLVQVPTAVAVDAAELMRQARTETAAAWRSGGSGAVAAETDPVSAAAAAAAGGDAADLTGAGVDLTGVDLTGADLVSGTAVDLTGVDLTGDGVAAREAGARVLDLTGRPVARPSGARAGSSTLAAGLRAALLDEADTSLSLRYVPLLDTSTAAMTGVRARAVWRPPGQGSLFGSATMAGIAQAHEFRALLTRVLLRRLADEAVQVMAHRPGLDLMVAVDESDLCDADLLAQVVTEFQERGAALGERGGSLLLTLVNPAGRAAEAVPVMESVASAGICFGVGDVDAVAPYADYLAQPFLRHVHLAESIGSTLHLGATRRFVSTLRATYGWTVDLTGSGVSDAAALPVLAGMGVSRVQGDGLGTVLDLADLTAGAPSVPPFDGVRG